MKNPHSILRAISIIAMMSWSLATWSVNPFLPLWEHIPDGEPYVFEDPDNPGHYRVYLYGSHDNLITEYCGRDQVVWSAPVEDLNQWRCDGVIFESKLDANGKPLNAGGVGDVLYAPDVTVTVDKDNKKTYWLYPNNQAGGRQTMVAKSDRPDGPFTVCNWDENNPQATVGVLYFDPAVFTDDDGRVYGYWGFDRSYAAELDPSTMATVRKGKKIVEDLIPSRQQDDVYRFFEASSMRKIEDKYVFIYSRWSKDGDFGLPQSNYTLAYAYSDNPLGPFTYGGTIIDGRARDKDSDGNTIATATPNGNTHGSIVEINGQWWVFYHRQTGHDEFSRQAMVAPIEVSVEKGKGGKVTISEGEYTSEGFETDGLQLLKTYPAGIACYYTGPKDSPKASPRLIYSGPYPYANRQLTPEGDIAVGTDESRATPIVGCTDGSVLGYKYFNFDTAEGMDKLRLDIELIPCGIDATVTVFVGAPSSSEGGTAIGRFDIHPTEPTCPQTKHVKVEGLGKLKGKQPLYLSFSSEKKGVPLCSIYSLGFAK